MCLSVCPEYVETHPDRLGLAGYDMTLARNKKWQIIFAEQRLNKSILALSRTQDPKASTHILGKLCDSSNAYDVKTLAAICHLSYRAFRGTCVTDIFTFT